MKNSRATIQKRQEEILEFLRNNPKASAEEIAAEMSVSPATVRRDIRALKLSGDIQTQFGPSRLKEPLRILPAFDDERFLLTNQHEKEQIARQAAELLKDGDTVFINSSSTALEIYPYITNKNIIIVTNNAKSLLMNRNPGTELILTGGEIPFQPNSGKAKMSMVGDLAITAISRITATKCILGVSGISAEGGLTSMAMYEPAINRTMMQRCNGPIIVLADHRKIGVEHNFQFAKTQEITYLITDQNRNQNELEEIQKLGVQVIVTGIQKSAEDDR